MQLLGNLCLHFLLKLWAERIIGVALFGFWNVEGLPVVWGEIDSLLNSERQIRR